MKTQAVSVNLNPGTAKQAPQQEGGSGFSDLLGNVSARAGEKRQAGCAGSDTTSQNPGQTREQRQTRSDFRYTESASHSYDSQKTSTTGDTAPYDSTAVKTPDDVFDPTAAEKILDDAVSAVLQTVREADKAPTAEETVNMLVQVLRKLEKDSEKAETDAVLKALMKVVDAMTRNDGNGAGTTSAAAILFGIAPGDKTTEELPETGLAQTFSFTFTEKHTEITMLSFEETVTAQTQTAESVQPQELTESTETDGINEEIPADVLPKLKLTVTGKDDTGPQSGGTAARTEDTADINITEQDQVISFAVPQTVREDEETEDKSKDHPEFIKEALRTEAPTDRKTERHRERISSVRITDIKDVSGITDETEAQQSVSFDTVQPELIPFTGETQPVPESENRKPDITLQRSDIGISIGTDTANTVQPTENDVTGITPEARHTAATAPELTVKADTTGIDRPEQNPGTEAEANIRVDQTALFLNELVSKAKKELGLTEARVTVTQDGTAGEEAPAFNPGANELQLRLGRSDKSSELDYILSGGREEVQDDRQTRTETYDAVHMASRLIEDRTEVTVRTEPEIQQPATAERPPEIQTAQQILERMDALRTNGHTEFVMVLNPESLGRITVKLVSAGARVAVEINAENPETRQLLEARAENMQTVLRNNGVELERYQVVSSGEDTQQLMQQDYDGSSKNPYSGRQTDENDTDDDDDADNFYDILQSI